MGRDAGRTSDWRDVAGDPVFGGVLLLGLVGMAFSPAQAPALWLLAVMAIAEELLFRGVVQDWIESRWGGRLGPVTVGNGCASVVFAAVHLYAHPPLWALATAGPSLCYGVVWSRHRSLWACAVAHFVHNLCFFYL